LAGPAMGAELKAGAARVSITPRTPIRLGGRNASSNGVASEIYARALALEDGSGSRAVIVTADLLGLPRNLTERAAVEIMKAQGLERGQILFTVTGTRDAPMVRGLQPALEPESGPEEKRIEQYAETLVHCLSDVAGAAIGDLEPARLHFGMGRIAPVGRPSDEDELPVLRVLTPKGGVIGVLFGSATQDPAPMQGPAAISGGFEGEAEAAIEKEFPGAIALFYRLCGGPGGESTGTTLAAQVTRLMKAPMTPVRGRMQTALIATALPVVQRPGQRAEARNAMRQAPFAVQVVRFQEGFALLALSGDVGVECVQKLRRTLHNRELVVAGCPGDGAAAVSEGEAAERALDAAARAWKRAGKP